MITSVSVARFYWMPLVWMFVVFLSLLIVALICNIFDSRAEKEIEMRDKSSIDENEIVNEEHLSLARKYLTVWMSNRYKYVILPFILFAVCLAVLFTE